MIFDLVVVAIILISCIIAFLRGFIREVLTILGVVGGAFAGIYVGPLLAPTVRGWLGAGEGAEEPGKLLGVVPMSLVGDIAAYGGVFIIVVIILSVASHFLASWAKAVGLGAIDRSFGVVFGIVRALVVLALFYLPFYLLADEEFRDKWFAGSKTRIYVETTSGWAAQMLPKSEEVGKHINAETVKAARTKLQELDVLRKDAQEAQPKTPDKDAEGYDDGERKIMNELINEKLND